MDDFVLRALAAGIGVALAAGPLGAFVVWGRMAYFGETLAHSALLGVALGLAVGLDPTWPVIAVAGVVALALAALQGSRGLATDTLLGIFAQGSLAASLVVLAFLKTVRVDLLGYLFGDVLAVTPSDVAFVWIAAAVSLAVLRLIWRPLLSLTVHEELARVEGVPVAKVRLVFMLLIALIVALAMKIVGLLPVTALLIIPAAAARPFSRIPEQMAALAAIIGCIAVALGLWGSLLWDTPSGPSIVVAATAAFALSRLAVGLRLSPRH
ncbi:MAG TPA: iron chelate uptake ABC transporter family permease subunit [Alphaproteobacteria bacterium]|nr:iron chelate uptake ABC transporter family permease subunit [Alphaproteobacteria bacterium]